LILIDFVDFVVVLLSSVDFFVSRVDIYFSYSKYIILRIIVERERINYMRKFTNNKYKK
jgi:hypothetical protein